VDETYLLLESSRKHPLQTLRMSHIQRSSEEEEEEEEEFVFSHEAGKPDTRGNGTPTSGDLRCLLFLPLWI